MKPNNLLISDTGVLKVADFGLARDIAEPGMKMTCQVITRLEDIYVMVRSFIINIFIIDGTDLLNYCLVHEHIRTLLICGLSVVYLQN